MKKERKVYNVIRILLCLAVLLLIVFPFLWLLS
jgi:multiple sugar transport system permease protein